MFEKSKMHREIGAAVYVAPNCTAALSHLDVHPEDYKGNYYRGVGPALTQWLSPVHSRANADAGRVVQISGHRMSSQRAEDIYRGREVEVAKCM